MNILDSIPSATEANQKRREISNARSQAEAERVLAALTKAIERGETSVTIEPPFGSFALIEALKAKGYSVRHRQTGPNESGTEISW